MHDLAVIMSVYRNDKLKFVKESVLSILNQTFPEFDYYIIFDGPVASDIDNFISSLKDNRIRLFRLEKNDGLAGALNYLLEIVLKNPEYRLIARMDADDISLPARFEKQRAFLSENAEVSVVGSWYEEIDESGNLLATIKLPTDHKILKKRYFTGTPFAHSTVMYRTQLIEKAGLYPTDTILMEDNVLWGRALNEGLRFANIPEILFRFRIDRDFYRRRSGINYGWKYIQRKSELNNKLNSPFYLFPLLVGKGFLKMFPSFIFKYIFTISRRYS